MIVSIFFSLFLSGCSISNPQASPHSQEAQVRLKLKTLQAHSLSLYELSHQLESDIDEIRRNADPHSEAAIQQLEKQIKELRQQQEIFKEEFNTWKLLLTPENLNE